MSDSSYDISILKDEKLKEKIQADELHRQLKQEILNVMYERDKLTVKKRELEKKLVERKYAGRQR